MAPTPKPPAGRIRPLLASVRVANLPTVAGNVWLGIAVAVWIATLGGSAFPFISASLWLIPSGLALYLGGNLLNDWQDREWDSRHRPERALPSGAFHPTSYLLAGAALLALGIALALAFHPRSAATAALIALAAAGYTAWHKRHPASVALVAFCRALLPLLPLTALPTQQPSLSHGLAAGWAFPSLALFLHVVGLSARARHESAGSGRGGPAPAATLVFSGPLMAVGAMLLTAWQDWMVVLAPFAVWAVWTLRALSRFGVSPAKQVSALLAGIPLLDWILLLHLGTTSLMLAKIQPIVAVRPPGAAVDVNLDFGYLGGPGMVSLLLPPLAFLTSLALQRLAPAT